MAINPDNITTIRVDQLPDDVLTLDSLFPHTVGSDLKSSTIQELVDLVATSIGVSGGVGYIALSVTDGQQLPDVPTSPSFFLCGAGTFLNINGFPDVICTENLNAIMSLSDHWQLAVAIPINPLSGSVQSVTGTAVDNTDPLNPIINSTGGGSLTLDEVVTNGESTSYDEGDNRLLGITLDKPTGVLVVSAGTEGVSADESIYSVKVKPNGIDKFYKPFANSVNSSLTKIRFDNGTLPNDNTITFKAESGTVAILSDITGGGATNLGYTPSPTNGIVTSDTGTDATLPLADGTNAGLLKPAKFTVLENTSGTKTGDQDLSALAPKASPTFTGTATTPAIIVSSETASRIASFDASKNIKSLDTATYPDLTELSYLKGLTSALQTQLNARVKTIQSDTASSSAVTGTTAETLAKTYTITANTFSATDFLKFIVSLEKTGFAGVTTIRVKANTTNNFATATTIATYASTNASFTDVSMERKSMAFKSGVLRGSNGTASLQSDIIQTASARLNLTLAPTSDFYLYISIQNASAGDSSIINAFNLTN